MNVFGNTTDKPAVESTTINGSELFGKTKSTHALNSGIFGKMNCTFGMKQPIKPTNVWGERIMLQSVHDVEMSRMHKKITTKNKVVRAKSFAIASLNETIQHLTQSLTDTKKIASDAYVELENRYLDTKNECEEMKEILADVEHQLIEERRWSQSLINALSEMHDDMMTARNVAKDLLDKDLDRYVQAKALIQRFTENYAATPVYYDSHDETEKRYRQVDEDYDY